MDIGKIFGERLFNLREARGETQEQLAKAVGITRQSLSRYETNERTPNIELIYNVAKHYEVSADYLLGLSEVGSLDKRVQAACEVTGLREEAIERIQFAKAIKIATASFENKKKTATIDVLNRIICNDDFIMLLNACGMLYHVSSEFVENFINDEAERKDSLTEKVDLQIFRATEQFRKILEKLKHPAYEKAIQYKRNYLVWHIVEGINNGAPFVPIAPFPPLRPMTPPYPKSLSEDEIEELKKNEPTPEEIEQYNKNIEYHDKIVKQAELDMREIAALFEQEEAENNGEHNSEDQ